MKQLVPKNFIYHSSVDHPITFSNETGDIFQIRFVRDKIVQVFFSRNGVGIPLSPSLSPVPFEVNHPQTHILKIITPSLHISVDFANGLNLTWIDSTTSVVFAQDLVNRAYAFDAAGRGVFHYMLRNSSEVYCGLGERTGNINLHGRRFRLEGFDSMGYDAEMTDPLYKYSPFYVTLSKDSSIAYGLFYNNMSRTVLDLGAEIDALWGPYRYYHAESGPLDYYLFFGPSIQMAFDGFASLIGRPRSLPPRYSFGYLASSMGYAEAEDAQELIEAFPELCRKYGIPCDGLHLSSGYTVNSSGERCVFTWNLKRFPNAKQLMNKLKTQGIHVLANIKPWLLESHPQYEKIKALKGFIWDPVNNQPARVMQWSAGAGTCACASYIDFSSVAGFNFWKQSIKDSLLENGISGCWNDNNEFTMMDDTNTFAMELLPDISLHRHLSQTPTPAGNIGAPLQTLMMAQSSYEAMHEFAPKHRPFVITRSAAPWCHQFAAQTWSGDNYTDWKTIKFNIPMGLSAGLSAFPGGYGHDVGGFAGPRPSPELLVRWVQAGILNPRFCIHSWKTDGSITEPWMYPSVLPIIRRSIQFRMRLIPYLYSLQIEFHRTLWPMMRPLFWHFQHDPRTYEQGFEYFLGDSMLVAPVWEEGARTRTLYLPFHNSGGWFNFQTGDHLCGGEIVTVEAPLCAALAPVFVPAGGMIPLGRVMRHVGEIHDDERIVYLFPPPICSTSGRTERILIDDDGITTNHTTRREYSELKLWMETTTGHIDIKVGLEIVHAGFKPAYDVVWVVVATNENREIVVDCIEKPKYKKDDMGRKMVGIPVIIMEKPKANL